LFLTSGRRYGKWILVVVLLLLFDVGLWKKIRQKSVHQTPGNGKTVEVLLNTKNDSSEISTPSTDALQQPVKTVSDEYPYDIAEDRKSFDPSVIDITVGDRLYMTQINDWYINFQNYAGKTVEIEGYFLNMGKYTFVGRNGPVCPYCTGGYVDFEFQTDQDLSGFTSQETWIAVTGILREGKIKLSNRETKPFYYIEALNVQKMNHTGVNPISD